MCDLTLPVRGCPGTLVRRVTLVLLVGQATDCGRSPWSHRGQIRRADQENRDCQSAPVTIPFADSEIQQRLTNQQVTGPYYSGTTVDGDQIAFIAETVVTPQGQVGSNRAENVDMRIDFVSGSRVTVTAREAEVNIAKDETDLFGEVEIITSKGYVLRSDLLHMRLSQIDIVSPGAVTTTGPLGRIDAGAMRLFTPDGQTGSELHFTAGVKLLYTPQP